MFSLFALAICGCARLSRLSPPHASSPRARRWLRFAWTARLVTTVNGVFALEEALYNGRALYRKVGDPHCWLWFAIDGAWTVSNTGVKDANDCALFSFFRWAYSVTRGLSLPTDPSVWKLGGSEQPAMRVAAVSVQVSARRARAARARKGARGRASLCVDECWVV